MTQLLQNAVFGTALILAAALLRRALGGRLIPEARLALWFVCLIRLLAPVFPESGLSLWGLLPRTGTASTPAPAPVGGTGNLPAVNAPVSGTVNPGPVPVEPAGGAFPWEAVALSLWIGVGLLLAVWYVLRWNRTRRAVAEAIPLPRDDPRYAPLPRCARLREGVMDGAPLTFGAARPTVVLWPGLSGTALDCVLAHEGVHARRRDNLWHYAMALALVVYWWNPAVWLMARLLRRDIELACDRAAVRKLGPEKRAEYAETLVALATAGAEPAFCRTFGRKAAEERILSVMKFKKTTVLGVVLSLALVAGVTVAFASGPRETEKDVAEEHPAADYMVNPVTYPGAATDFVTYPGAAAEDVRAWYGAVLARRVSEGYLRQEDAELLWAGLEQWIAEVDRGQSDGLGFYPMGIGDIFSVPKDDEPAPAAVEQIPADYVRYPGAAAEDVRARYGGLLVQLESEGAVTHAGADAMRANLEKWIAQVDSGELDELGFNPAGAGEIFAVTKGDEPEEVPERGVEGQPAPAESKIPEFVPDYDPKVEDSTKAGDEPAGEMGSSFYDYTIVGTDENGYPVDEQGNSLVFDDSGNLLMKVRSGYAPCIRMDCNISQEHHHEGAEVVYHYNTLPAELHVCPVEGCTVRGTHTHDGVTYLCNGAHCGGVCDGSCAAAWNGADTVPTAAPVSSGHHGDSHHGNGYHGGHH